MNMHCVAYWHLETATRESKGVTRQWCFVPSVGAKRAPATWLLWGYDEWTGIGVKRRFTRQWEATGGDEIGDFKKPPVIPRDVAAEMKKRLAKIKKIKPWDGDD